MKIPHTGKITAVTMFGKRMEIDPPVDVKVGDVIHLGRDGIPTASDPPKPRKRWLACIKKFLLKPQDMV